MNEPVKYLNTLPDFVQKKSAPITNQCMIQQFMRKPETILQIDITGKYRNTGAALSSWRCSIKRSGYHIRTKAARHNNREYLFLIKDPDGTATL